LAGFKDRIFLGHELFAGKTAINDKELYNKFLTYTDNIKNNFFGCIVTTTTHPPYVDPLTNSYDINKAFKFSDEALDWFIKELSRKKFFDNGIVVITGDHRAWEPISQKEKRIYGDFAGAMTPVSIIGPNLNGEIPFDIQSCDINPSLGYLLKQTQDFLPWQKNIFTGKEEKNSRIILHHSGIDRDKIYYKHESNTGYVLLDGDNTCASTSTDQYPVDVINLYRILF